MGSTRFAEEARKHLHNSTHHIARPPALALGAAGPGSLGKRGAPKGLSAHERNDALGEHEQVSLQTLDPFPRLLQLEMAPVAGQGRAGRVPASLSFNWGCIAQSKVPAVGTPRDFSFCDSSSNEKRQST